MAHRIAMAVWNLPNFMWFRLPVRLKVWSQQHAVLMHWW